MIDWVWFPKSSKPTELAEKVVKAFEAAEASISSGSKNLKSDHVLSELAPHLKNLGFRVESGKKKHEKIEVPVLYGLRGKPEKSFCVDAFHETEGFVVEVEAGSAVDGGQFLKDFFEACVMDSVRYSCIAARQVYGKAKNKNFEYVRRYFETIYACNRLTLPLKGMLVVGY